MADPIPTIADRLEVLRELLAQLPLFQPHTFYGRDSDETGVPRVASIGGTNCDDDDRYAAALGAPAPWVAAQMADEFDEEAGRSRLPDLPPGLVPPERMIGFEELAQANDTAGARPLLWWGLTLPVLNPARDRGVVVAQLCWQQGAEDFAWLALRPGPHAAWHLARSLDLRRIG